MAMTEIELRNAAWLAIIVATSFFVGMLLVRHIVATQMNSQYALFRDTKASSYTKTSSGSVDVSAATLSAHIVNMGNPALQGCGCPACCAAA